MSSVVNTIGGGLDDLYNAGKGIVKGAVGTLTPASTAGVQQAAGDATRNQNMFWSQYQLQQPGTAPQMQAAAMQAALAGQAPGVAAAQMTPQQAQAAHLDASGLAPWSQGQQGLAGSLQNTISNPNASSVAQIQQQQAFAQQMAQQQGLAAAMGRGGNTALAMRTAMGNVGNLGAQQASASALQRANEVAAAQGQLGNVLQQGAGNALNVAAANQGAEQSTNLANLSAATQAASQNAQQQQQAGQFNAQQAQAIALANQAAQQQAAQLNAQNQQQANAQNQQSALQTRTQDITQQGQTGSLMNQANANAVNAQVGSVNAQNQGKQMTGNLVSTGLGALALSDERAKEDIRQIDSSMLREFAAAMSPDAWRYKGDPQTHVGPMAQDIERSAVGKTIIRETPAGKAIDIPSATSALLASLADMHKRVAALESGGGSAAAMHAALPRRKAS